MRIGRVDVGDQTVTWAGLKDFVSKYRVPLAVIGCLAALAAAFLMGRYTGPTKTVEKTQIQVVEKQVVKTEIKYVDREVRVKDTARNVHREVRVVKAPDGTVTTTVVTDDKTKINQASSKEVQSTSDTLAERSSSKTLTTEKTVESARPDWHMALQLGAGAALPIEPQMAIGAVVERRIAGPFWAGLWINVQLSVAPTVVPRGVIGGLSMGLEF